MILLTKIDKAPILVNAETIKSVESVPDTLILFLNGDTLFVEESFETIIAKTEDFKARIIRKTELN